MIIHRGKPWNFTRPPKRILALRFHALGDIMITLPYLASLKRQYPDAELHVVTCLESLSVPASLKFIDAVHTFDDKRNGKRQFLLMFRMLWRLRKIHFDVVLDLQHNKASRFLRFALRPTAWSEFDRATHAPAAERTRACIAFAGFSEVGIETSLTQKSLPRIAEWMSQFNLTERKILVLNPAGGFPSRNWPLSNYFDFTRRWLQHFPDDKVVLLGLSSMKQKFSLIKQEFGEAVVDLTGLTSQAEAFGFVHQARLVLSEDGGLMHMAWVQGVPTVALFGSTAAYWSSPQGDWSYCFNSSDLPCGNCLQAVCQFGDNRCLTRYDAETVFRKALELLSKNR